MRVLILQPWAPHFEYTFTLSTPYTIQLGDKILIEYGGPTSISIDIWNVDKVDGNNTRRMRFLTPPYVSERYRRRCGNDVN